MTYEECDTDLWIDVLPQWGYPQVIDVPSANSNDLDVIISASDNCGSMEFPIIDKYKGLALKQIVWWPVQKT